MQSRWLRICPRRLSEKSGIPLMRYQRGTPLPVLWHRGASVCSLQACVCASGTGF